MPKKRSVNPAFNKRLQRMYRRLAAGPSVTGLAPTPQADPGEGQEHPVTAPPATPKTHTDMQRLIAAETKRRRKGARRLAQS